MALSKQVIQPIKLATGLPGDLNQKNLAKSQDGDEWFTASWVINTVLSVCGAVVGALFSLFYNLATDQPPPGWSMLVGAALGAVLPPFFMQRAFRRDRRKRLPFDKGVGENPVRFVRRMYRKFSALNKRIAEFNRDLATCQGSIVQEEVEHWRRCRQLLVEEQGALVAEVNAAIRRQEQADELRLEAYRLQCSGAVATKSLVASGCVDTQDSERGLDVLSGHAQRRRALNESLQARGLSGDVTPADVKAIERRRQLLPASPDSSQCAASGRPIPGPGVTRHSF